MPEVAQLRRGRAGMQTQVCWTSHPVSFPWPLEKERGGLHLPSSPPASPPSTHTLRGSWSALAPPQPLTAPLAPTAPYHFPSLHSKAQLPSPRVPWPQGQVLRLQHSKLADTKALSTTDKALMTLPTAKVLISLPPNPELKLAPNAPKPKKVGLKL